MKNEKVIARLREKVASLNRRIEWLIEHTDQMEQCPEASISLLFDTMDFDLLSHAEVVKVLLAFPGYWNKKIDENDGKPTIHYTQEVDGITVRCWHGQPPPSCRIVEESVEIPETVIPAHKEIKRKLVCRPEMEVA